MLPAAIKDRSPHSPPYQRHRPERTLLYQIVERHYPEFRDVMALQGKALPVHVQQEFADYLKCGRLEHGFMRVRCTHCHHEHLVAFSCKRRGFCPSCGARRMAESAALLADEVLPEQRKRQRISLIDKRSRAATPRYLQRSWRQRYVPAHGGYTGTVPDCSPWPSRSGCSESHWLWPLLRYH
jgi:ribosomal protein S27E